MKLPILAALGLAAASGAADASTFLVTYTGAVTSGYDSGGFFSPGGSDLVGQHATLRFWINSDTPGAEHDSDSNYNAQSLVGGGVNNPIFASSFTLNNSTIAWGNSFADGYDDSAGGVDWQNDYGSPPVDGLSIGSYDYGSDSDYNEAEADISSEVNIIVDADDPLAPLEYDVQPGDTTYAYFSTDIVQGLGRRDATAVFDLAHISIVSLDASAVPEPASWAMMVIGFSLTGAALRRRPEARATT